MNQTQRQVPIYMAPLEGITKYSFRNAHHHFFPGVTKYFAPFIDGRINRPLKSREINDVLPQHNSAIPLLIPQIMCNDNVEGFLATAKQLHELGYHELNLNLGCPSLTVVRKGKGAGFLAYPSELEKFLLEIFQNELFASKHINLSIKTRIGIDDTSEMKDLLRIYNQIPLSELIVHPRLQTDYYKKPIHFDAFKYITEHTSIPLVFNGEIKTKNEILNLLEQFSSVSAIMIGRGFLYNPALSNSSILDAETFRKFHDQIFLNYQELLSGDLPVLHKMKELWVYWIENFKDSKKLMKELKKSQDLKTYKEKVSILIDYHFIEKEPTL